MLQFFEMRVDADTRASQVALTVKNPHANAVHVRDVGLIPKWGRSPGEGSGNALQCFCLENPMAKEPGRLQPTGSQSGTRLSDSSQMTQVSLMLEQFSENGYRVFVLRLQRILLISLMCLNTLALCVYR